MPQRSPTTTASLDPQVEQDLQVYLEGIERWVDLSRHEKKLRRIRNALGWLLDFIDFSEDEQRKYFVATLARAVYVLPIVFISALVPVFYEYLPLVMFYSASALLGVFLTARRIASAPVFYALTVIDVLAVGIGVHLTGSLTTPAVVFYPIMAILGAAFLGMRTGLFFAAICCASYTALVLLEGLGFLPYSPMLGIAFPYEWTRGIPAYPIAVLLVAHVITFGGAFLAGLITYEIHARRRSAEQAVRTKNELLSICSHDLKNLLVISGGYAELLTEALSSTNEEAAEQARQIHVANQRMLELIRNLLDASRLDMGSIALASESVSFERLANEVLKTQNPNAALQGVYLQVRCPQPAMIEGDPSKLVQVLTNLVQNAIAHTPRDGTVTLELRDTLQGRARLVVSDTGPGIAPETLAVLFDPAALARQRRQQNRPLGLSLSTGLGMSIVRRFVELHGGTVRIESCAGVGTDVWVELPLAGEHKTQDAPQTVGVLQGAAV